MRNFAIALAATTALTFGAGVAAAQSSWVPIVEREAVIEDGIQAGLASGDLTAAEANALHADIRGLVALEGDYRRYGLSAQERFDLDRRFAAIRDRVGVARVAGAVRSEWVPMEARKATLNARIDAGLRDGDLTAEQAADLREDFDAIAAAEADYRVDGLSVSERADLDSRFDALSARITDERIETARSR